MKMNLTRKIIAAHLASPSDMTAGKEILIRVDQTLTHDINAVMSYLALEALGIDRCRIEKSVSYLDHNLLYLDNKTPDDHLYLQTVAKRYGVYVSRAGNGVMHAVHLARFSQPGKLCLGGDSHTAEGGAVGMLAIGVGGMDVTTAMAGLPVRLKMPYVVRVNLKGSLKPGVSAKDVALEMLRRVKVKGGVGKVYEYVGEGAASLSVVQRATIANMGAEMGATSSLFAPDEQTRDFFAAQKRSEEFTPVYADPDAEYDEEMEVDLSSLEPLCACPHQPDNVVKLRDVEKKKVQQVFIGGCTNTSYSDVARAALVLKGRHVKEDVSCTCAVSSRQIYRQLLDDGYIGMLMDAGVRMLEIACGPCCAIGQSPASEAITVRSSNRNFMGRSGNPTAKIYLVSAESAAATAITGTFTSPWDILSKEELKALASVTEPQQYIIDDSMLIKPLAPEEAKTVEIIRGPNIRPLPVPDPPEENLTAEVSLKTGDNITTDDITPGSAELSSMRSNIPLMSRYCYHNYDPTFAERARALGKSIIIGGENYGQGSSREHAAINPMYLGVKIVIAKSLARIHKGNLVNHGIIPMVFADPADYDRIEQGDSLTIEGLPSQLHTRSVLILNNSKGFSFTAKLDISDGEMEIISNGGQLRTMQSMLRTQSQE